MSAHEVHILANSGVQAGTASISFDCANGNLLLVLSAGGSDEANEAGTITYNGKQLTRGAHEDNPGDSYASVWYLWGPDGGSNTLTMVGAATQANNDFVALGLANAASIRGYVTADGAGTSSSQSIVTVVDDLVLDAFGKLGGIGKTAGTLQTVLYNSSRNGASYLQASGTSTTMTWSDSTMDYAHALVAVVPSQGRGGCIIF
jgi:hypothetical protein